MIGFVPVTGWAIENQGDDWATFAHEVRGRPKALVSFSAQKVSETDTWWSWNVAACDPAEFDPAVAVTNGAKVWTDRTGQRVPFARVGERSICGGPPTFLLADGHAFALAGSPYLPDRVVGRYVPGGAVPAGARDTGYRQGDRRLWIGRDAAVAYVGSALDAERLPRIRDDDTSVTDCN